MLSQKTGSIEQKVHKHVAAIHCSGELSLFQRKIINCLLYKAYPKLQEESRFKVEIRELLNMMGLKNNDYRYLREAFKNIRKTDISWNLTSEDFSIVEEDSEYEAWIDCSWLSWAMSDGSSIHFEFPLPLREYLVQPAVYASISLKMQQKFTSKYALILYENCTRYANIGKTKMFPISTFRGIMGVKDGQYKIFRDFNAKVLKPAITQVNQHTDLDVEVVKKRERRKVVGIQFLVKRKKVQKKVEEGSKPLYKTTQQNSILPNKISEQDKDYYQFVEEFRNMAPSRREFILEKYEAQLRENIVNGDDVSQKILQHFMEFGWDNRVCLTSIKKFSIE